jgi:alkylated DNA repair dioxygenase AlkB
MNLFAKFEPKPQDLVNGLTLVEDFISEKEELDLIKNVNSQSWITDLKRRVQHYGYKYDYKARRITEDFKVGNIPDLIKPISKRLLEQGYFKKLPDQVIVNEYESGQGISSHIDCVPCFEETVASLSLASDCVMDFINSETNQKISILLPRRSLLILKDDARYKWQHGIASRKTDKIDGQIIKRKRRISLTFRNVILIS